MSKSQSHLFLLLLTSVIVSFCGFPLATTHAYIGKDISINLYNDLDREYDSIANKLLTHALRGSAARLDKLTLSNPLCKAVKWCFAGEKDFSTNELDSIRSGAFAPFLTRAGKKFQANNIKPTTEDLESLRKAIADNYSNLQVDVRSNIRWLSEIGLIGLYADGNLDNSSFDLMYDLEQIHKVIFSETIPYEGSENATSQWMLDLLSGVFDNNNPAIVTSTSSGNAIITIDPSSASSSSSGTTASGTSSSGNSTTQPITILSGCNPTDLINLDSGLYSDIWTQLESGNNNSSSTPQGNTSLSGTLSPDGNIIGSGSNTSNASGSRSAPRNNKLTDSFPCNTFFCIRINMTMYQQLLLGGGKTYSIESVLDKNFKIVDRFSGNSLIATKMTKNFFESSFKDLNLGSRVHLGVMVTTKPVKLLNLAPKGKSGDNLNMKQKQTTAQIIEQTLADYCLNYKTQNNLDPNGTATKSEIMKSAELTSIDAIQKTPQAVICEGRQMRYSQSIRSDLRTGYYTSVNNDLMALDSFSSTFRDNIISIIGLIKSMYAKK